MSDKDPIRAALGECRPLFLSAFWFGLFINALMLAVPIYSMQVLDRVLSSGSLDTLVMLTIIVGVSVLFMGLLQGLRALVFSHIGRWLDDKLSSDIVQKTLNLALHKPNIGSQPLRDLATIRGFVTSPALGSLFDAPWSVIYFIVIFMINLWLGVTVVLGAALMLALALVTEKLPAKRSAQANDEQIKAMQAMDAVIRNAEVVKAMGLLEQASRRWRVHNRQWLEHAFSASNLQTVVSHTTRTLRMGLQVLLTGQGAWLVISGGMSAGGIIAVSILSGKALAPFDAAVSIYQAWANSQKAYKRLTELNPASSEANRTMMLPEPRGEISIEKLTFQEKQGSRWILRGINIRIGAGESVGIIGPSGTGKTTLARLLVGVAQPTSGSVRLDGASLDQWDPDQLGRLIGYLPQGVELFSGTVAENIARLDGEADPESIVMAARLAQVHDYILQLPNGYQTDIGLNGALLSAGQKQRIALARCFYRGARLVVLDEPNAHLDAEGELAFVQCLMQAKERGITTITIAHRPSVLQKVDKILVLQGGEAKMYGPATEVLDKMMRPEQNVLPIRRPHGGESELGVSGAT
ncbi:MAG: type I secretion system permease/ATPase [Gammaproteobacteria bacterium]|nr:type I secretion system permease/ATPase [Gammaproteobacteria bacterium]MBU1656183.1 type I secretion system permease/ATPase [Gammaproteobacteria bacterium]MBU1961316.1 type I secretion system permease/ATPase [Gammaproteobacteria bacterium]